MQIDMTKGGIGRHIAVILAATSLTACGSETTAMPNGVDNTQGGPSANRNAEQQSTATPIAPPSLSSTDRAAIMRAAGFSNPHGDGRWRYGEDGCDDVFADITEARDINRDGQLDAIINADDDQCMGMNQRMVILLTRRTNGWTVVTDFQKRFAVYSFHPRPGLAWPDIEIFDGMTGEQRPDGSIHASGCEPFLRWNGREYIDGGTSRNGAICELTAEGRVAAGANAPAQGSAASFPPIEKGYYAIGLSCAQAITGGGDQLAYLDERRFASFDGGQQVQAFDALGGNRYRIRATSFDENDRATRVDSMITVNGRTSFTNEYGDRYTHCPITQVPRAIRQEWGDLARR